MSASQAPPELSVIIAAYRRREFLGSAVESVARQTVDRGRLEVVVLTDTTDPALDAFLSSRGIAHRVDPEPEIGPWLLGAIDATHAPWVAVLEDDDLLEPDRFARALSVIRENPGLGYYRNRLTVVDTEGRPVPPMQWKRIEREPALDRRGPVRVGASEKGPAIERMRREGLEWLNLSSMVFHREIFTPRVRAVVARCHCPDLFVFVAAVLAPRGLLLDDRRLTQYCRHPGSASRSLDWRRRHAADHARLLALAEAENGPTELVRWLRDRTRMLERVVEAGDALRPIRENALPRASEGSTRRYLRALASEPVMAPPAALRWGAGALASAYRIAPRATSRVLRECDRWFDLP